MTTASRERDVSSSLVARDDVQTHDTINQHMRPERLANARFNVATYAIISCSLPTVDLC